MSPATGLDPALLEAAIRRKDASAVRELLAGATEPDRQACAKALKELLTEPRLPDLAMMMMPIPRLMFTERLRSEPPPAELLREIAEHNREAGKHQASHEEQLRTYREWRETADSLAFQLAALGLAGGVAAAAKVLEESAHSFDRTGHDDLVVAVLADRRPDWLADLIDRHLSQGWSSAWRLARGLVRLGLIPRLAAQLADLLPADGEPEQAQSADQAGELARLERRIGALPAARAEGLTAALSAVRRGEVPGPAVVAPGAGAPLAAPVTDPDELVHLLTVLIEDAADAIAAERALAGAVRLSGLPEAERRKAAAPLLKRAESVIREDSMFAGDVLASDIALVTWAWAGQPLPEAESDRETAGWRPDEFAVSGTGRALTMAGIFSARAWEAARTIKAGRGGLLLAEPETDRGTISPDGLLDRLHRLARQPAGGAPPNPHDRDVALLRLGPGATDSLWSAWADSAGSASETLGGTYRIINTPLTFEAVAGTPEVDEEDWRDPDRVLLVRTAGPVPAAPGCPSWQLLTRLADPLADYLPLTDVARFERHYEQFVAGWAMICPWQPELAAAHLLRPLSEGLTSRTSPATAAISALSHPGHPLGPVGHLALIEGLSGTEADTRIAAAELWAAACADGRLDPALAAAALTAGAAAQLVKLNRVAESLERASHSALAARRVVETVGAATDLISASPPNLHLLIELAARLGSSFGVPALPDGLRELAARRRGARLNVTAGQLVAAAGSQPAGQRQAAVQALTALVTRAESRH